MLIEMPSKIVRNRNHLFRDNPEYFQDTRLLAIDTSIESLAPDSPMLPVMLAGRTAPHVEYHNIVGVLSDDSMVGSFSAKGDGVVNYSSSHLEHVSSEQVVDADHIHIHRHPRSILEVRRILLEHLHDIHGKGFVSGPLDQAIYPATTAQGPPGNIRRRGLTGLE